jgi:dTMP kinase
MVRLITFEGGDGTGKSTQVHALKSYLGKTGRSCIVTREPGGTALGTSIRKVLLEVGEHAIASSTELFLYLADRSQHVHEIILPAIGAGKIVLCDRFTDSTLAYQGYGRGLDLARLRQLNDMASGETRPDLTFLLDCPVEFGLARTALRRAQFATGAGQKDRFEREEIDFHQKIRAGFLELARAEPKRFHVIDASQPIEEVSAAIRRIMDQELLQ